MKKLIAAAVLATTALTAHADRTSDVLGALILGGFIGADIQRNKQPEVIIQQPSQPVVIQQPAPIVVHQEHYRERREPCYVGEITIDRMGNVISKRVFCPR